jgi:hypothetical protein
MLSATIGNILAYADWADTAADQIEKPVGEYRSYAMALAKGQLPVHAFKAEGAFTRIPLDAKSVHAATLEAAAGAVTETTSGSVAKAEPNLGRRCRRR